MMDQAKEVDIAIRIGIDVSKDSVQVSEQRSDGRKKYSVTNSPDSLNRWAKKLKSSGFAGKIICEATGHFHYPLALACAQMELDLRVVNPLVARKHSRSRIRNTKTDGVDADVLCDMAAHESDLPKPAAMTREDVHIRLLQGQLASLEKRIQQMKSSFGHYGVTYNTLGLGTLESTPVYEQVFTLLKRLKDELQDRIEQLVHDSTDADDETIAHLSELPGVSSRSGALLSRFDRTVSSANSWVAYVGFDISERQSGKWRGRGFISKRGNSYLRRRLFQCAWGAKMNDGDFRRYYESLRERGFSYKSTMCILARKIVRLAYAVAAKGQRYDPTKAFPEHYA